jgi:hypothetical protein
MINVSGLPLEDWGRLQKFRALEHLFVDQRMGSTINDEYLRTLAKLSLPKLRDLNLSECPNVTDVGVLALTNLPSITSLGLRGSRVTDDGLRRLAGAMPGLTSLSLCQCGSLSSLGFLALTNAGTLNELSLSPDHLTQTDLERLIAVLGQVTWWGIDDRAHELLLDPLLKLQQTRKVTMVLIDGDTCRGIEDVMKSGYRTRPEK